ncbi:MAG: NAD(P)-dependent oxidoreductase [Pirellulaceae bacterium]|jgi:3-hydroxyisobutyrate dehydrogenase-like beta-hydroxyacid dehydrogenase|nr:NAD(P)-dependent oxidoreductase [Pirellulaceae bacterium]MDP7017178.1 NAD(P)-dependent oxidoreductase [Pirellulaceae bacterium]
MARIGIIGVGAMGGPMAENLLADGNELFVYARRPAVVDHWRDRGAVACDSPATVTDAAETIITILPEDDDVVEVVSGESGVAAAAAADKLLIEMSTIHPKTVRALVAQLKELGMGMIDAPVSGGPSGAAKATLTIMVGGADDDVSRAMTVLTTLGENIIHLGPSGAGQTTKLVNQLLAGGVMTLIGEALAIARAAELNLEQVAEVVSTSSGGSTIFSARHRFVSENRFEPGFRCDLMRKDVRLAIELAEQMGVQTDVARAALTQYASASASGDGDSDFSVVSKQAAAGYNHTHAIRQPLQWSLPSPSLRADSHAFHDAFRNALHLAFDEPGDAGRAVCGNRIRSASRRA